MPGGGAAQANPSQELARARSEFVRGAYERVIAQLDPARISDASELEEAHYLLGVSHFYLGHREQARQEFAALLHLNPQRELDAATESPEVYAFFVGLKSELRSKLEEIRREKDREQALRDRPSREIVVERTIHERSAWNNFVPLGWPQFHNHQRGKGLLFLGTQALFGGASLALFGYQALSYGIPQHVPPGDVGKVRTLEVLQIGTGGLFLVAYAWSILDGFANQAPAVEEKRIERPIGPGAPGALGAPAAPSPASRPSSQPSGLRLTPLVTPQSVGLGATWRF
jgi:tetratricopeptide (TPR) repeat protein